MFTVHAQMWQMTSHLSFTMQLAQLEEALAADERDTVVTLPEPDYSNCVSYNRINRFSRIQKEM